MAPDFGKNKNKGNNSEPLKSDKQQLGLIFIDLELKCLNAIQQFSDFLLAGKGLTIKVGAYKYAYRFDTGSTGQWGST